MLTQVEQMLQMMRQQPDGVCGTRFLEAHIGRYGARVADLRKLGYQVDRVVCDDEWHGHRSRQWTYRLVEPAQMELL